MREIKNNSGFDAVKIVVDASSYEVLTYVDADESDVAQVSLFTDYGTLGKMGLAYGKDFF
ncbi:MAG: hypothetical protein WAX07_06905 [Candidatus Altiarchaeia archaeon]